MKNVDDPNGYPPTNPSQIIILNMIGVKKRFFFQKLLMALTLTMDEFGQMEDRMSVTYWRSRRSVT